MKVLRFLIQISPLSILIKIHLGLCSFFVLGIGIKIHFGLILLNLLQQLIQGLMIG
jgi:hypothetical protein